jgi:RNA polymerase sigma-70 factor (ECF subfamily)
MVVRDLYERLGRAVLARVRQVVRRQDIAEEILQETFARLWELAPTFTTELAAFTWIYRTSHNLAVDHVRAAFTRGQRDADDPGLVLAGDEPVDEELARRQLVAAHLSCLTAEEASAMIYKVIDDMTHEQIGTFLGVSGKTVSRMLAKAERKLSRTKVRYDETKL